VLFPLFMFVSGQELWPELKPTGLIFSGLAGVAGAVGAICVIFASQSARAAGVASGSANPDVYRLFIGPLIFGLAPVINTLVSTVWHPRKGEPFHFEFHMPHPLVWVGILLVGAGAALVLYAKELSEAPAGPPTKAHSTSAPVPHPPETRS
jgi:hypothetical protein